MRRSYVTHLIEDGWDPLFVQQQVGDEHASTTAIHTCVSSDFRTRTLRRALDATIDGALRTRLSLPVLAALCDIFDTTPAQLIVTRAETAARRRVVAVGETPADIAAFRPKRARLRPEQWPAAKRSGSSSVPAAALFRPDTAAGDRSATAARQTG